MGMIQLPMHSRLRFANFALLHYMTSTKRSLNTWTKIDRSDFYPLRQTGMGESSIFLVL